MRITLIAFAITLALASCSQTGPERAAQRDDADAGTDIAVAAEASAAPLLDQRREREEQAGRLAKLEAFRVQQVLPAASPMAPPPVASMAMPLLQQPVSPQETYAGLPDNPLQSVLESPVSTFSIDVDTGSYSNIRRMLL
ncbi:MAG TPA: von Willebrand factor type A domain-containing protein, partial [Arenimonas sp.]|nr:von Willebrand factor type A domain-containing protein [Arenimonas sp.]